MAFSLFSATGCARCKIVKSYMEDNDIDYQEFDFKADGKDEFNAFYRKNRSSIFRGEEGVEFPLLYDGDNVVQGVGVIIAFLKEDKLLEKLVSRSDLSHGWVSGLDVSGVEPSLGDDFLEVVGFLADQGLKTKIETNGTNPSVLSRLVDKSLVDRLVFNLMGPAELYREITGADLSEDDLGLSLSLAEKCNEYQINLILQPFLRGGSDKDILSPDEASAAAAFLEKATASKTHPFFIKDCIQEKEKEAFGSVNLFKYRTTCRRYMVKTEIFKPKSKI